MFETILSGVLVFVMGQTILKMVVEPIHSLKQAFGDVALGLRVNAPLLYRSRELPDDVQRNLQVALLSLSGNLSARFMAVPGYSFWRWIFFLPKAEQIHKAAGNLATMSNWVNSESPAATEAIIQQRQEVSDILGIHIDPGARVSDELLDAAIRSSMGLGVPDIRHDK